MAGGPVFSFFFFSRARPVRMNLHEGAVQRHRLRLDLHAPLLLEVFEHPVEDPVLRPAIHPRTDGVPTPKPGWHPPSLAPLLDGIQDGAEDLRVRDAQVASLHRQKRRNAFVLCIGQFHP